MAEQIQQSKDPLDLLSDVNVTVRDVDDAMALLLEDSNLRSAGASSHSQLRAQAMAEAGSLDETGQL